MKWLQRRSRKKAVRKRQASREKDCWRHLNVIKRLKLRFDQAADNGDLHKCQILVSRIRRVRDIQIRELGC